MKLRLCPVGTKLFEALWFDLPSVTGVLLAVMSPVQYTKFLLLNLNSAAWYTVPSRGEPLNALNKR